MKFLKEYQGLIILLLVVWFITRNYDRFSRIITIPYFGGGYTPPAPPAPVPTHDTTPDPIKDYDPQPPTPTKKSSGVLDGIGPDFDFSDNEYENYM